MFYLTEFFKSLGESLVRGFFFLLFTCLLALGFTHRPWITKTVERITPEKLVNPYFVAVVDGTVDSQKIQNYMRSLPGVLSVKNSDTEGRSRISDLVASLGPDYQMSNDLLDFHSLRIVLNPSLSQESLQFVRNQVVKLGGKDHVTATPVKYPEVTGVMKAHPFYEFLGKSGDWGVLGVLALCWIISFWLTYDVFRSRSYIIEKFQRKKLVAAKTMATGLGVVMALFNILGIFNGTLKFFDSLLLFMVFAIFWTFTMQDWRWKPTL